MPWIRPSPATTGDPDDDPYRTPYFLNNLEEDEGDDEDDSDPDDNPNPPYEDTPDDDEFPPNLTVIPAEAGRWIHISSATRYPRRLLPGFCNPGTCGAYCCRPEASG